MEDGGQPSAARRAAVRRVDRDEGDVLGSGGWGIAGLVGSSVPPSAHSTGPRKPAARPPSTKPPPPEDSRASGGAGKAPGAASNPGPSHRPRGAAPQAAGRRPAAQSPTACPAIDHKRIHGKPLGSRAPSSSFQEPPPRAYQEAVSGGPASRKTIRGKNDPPAREARPTDQASSGSIHGERDRRARLGPAGGPGRATGEQGRRLGTRAAGTGAAELCIEHSGRQTPDRVAARRGRPSGPDPINSQPGWPPRPGSSGHPRQQPDGQPSSRTQPGGRPPARQQVPERVVASWPSLAHPQRRGRTTLRRIRVAGHLVIRPSLLDRDSKFIASLSRAASFAPHVFTRHGASPGGEEEHRSLPRCISPLVQ